jgi:hypothetical protein
LKIATKQERIFPFLKLFRGRVSVLHLCYLVLNAILNLSTLLLSSFLAAKLALQLDGQIPAELLASFMIRGMTLSAPLGFVLPKQID